MTNTKITDVEVLERKMPVVLREFSIDHSTGGRGKWIGGGGVVKDWECRLPLSFGVVSERRVTQPYGMEGGECGHRGINLVVKKTRSGKKRVINVGSSFVIDLDVGDHYIIHTPGGGGWGNPAARVSVHEKLADKFDTPFRANGTINKLQDSLDTSA